MKPLVVGNWKMNTNLADASLLATLVRNKLEDVTGVDVVLCPPHIWLQEVASVLEVSAPHIFLGAQDCYPEDEGPFTGEVSVAMLRDLCRYVIVGHSERREHFKETSSLISDKVQAVLKHGMTPILCIGEKEKSDTSIEAVLSELRASLKGVEKHEYHKVIVAYEPVWAISTTSQTTLAEGDYAAKVCDAIKEVVGAETRVLFGGSVSAETINRYSNWPSINGFLVGGASLKASNFVELSKKARGE